MVNKTQAGDGHQFHHRRPFLPHLSSTITSQHTLPHDPGRLLPLVRGDVGEVDGDVDDGLVEAQLVQRVADDLAVAAQQEPHRDGHLAVGGVVLSEREKERLESARNWLSVFILINWLMPPKLI